jgi:hypothetical protein
VFAEHDAGPVLIHRTDWNRLDVTLASTGELLTAREPTSFQQGEERPEHYLDYFHGRVVVSPDDRLVADDGWVWHPVGVPTSWSVQDWLHANPWESEDGESQAQLGLRTYYWDHGMCWVDNERLAIEGIGDDDQDMTEGVRIVSAVDSEPSNTQRGRVGRCTQEFAGPKGLFFSDGDRLFSADGETLKVWDIATGELSATIAGFSPTHQHKSGRELFQVVGRPARLLIWRY